MKATESVVGIILAGGLARRMGGGDKCLLPLSGKTLLQRSIDRAKPQVQELLLNANGNALRFARTRLPIVADQFEGNMGPLAGIHAGLKWVVDNSSNEWMLCMASDTPFFPADLAQRLLDAAITEHRRIVVAESDSNTHPVFSLWHISLLGDIEQQLRSGITPRLQDWTADHDATYVKFENNITDPFFNINTPQDLYAAETAALKMDQQSLT